MSRSKYTPPDGRLTVADAARRLGVTKQRVQQLALDGELDGVLDPLGWSFAPAAVEAHASIRAAPSEPRRRVTVSIGEAEYAVWVRMAGSNSVQSWLMRLARAAAAGVAD